MEKILITGGTGMIGQRLTKALVKKGYQVIILTRKIPGTASTGISYAEWDLEKQTIDKDAVSQADHVIHLAGANVGSKRWIKKRKKEIIESRVRSGELLVKALGAIPNKVKTVISSSAIGYYGPDPILPNPHPFEESDAPSNDFLGSVVQQWEGAIKPITTIGKRLVIFRSGIVLSREGGALPEYLKPLRFRACTILGNGEQMVSWIHIDDLVRAFIEAIENESWMGVFNTVAPHPVTNNTLVRTIASINGKLHFCVKVPVIALKIALGEMSIEVLKSTTVNSRKLEANGFQFLYPTIDKALQNLLST